MDMNEAFGRLSSRKFLALIGGIGSSFADLPAGHAPMIIYACLIYAAVEAAVDIARIAFVESKASPKPVPVPPPVEVQK